MKDTELLAFEIKKFKNEKVVTELEKSGYTKQTNGGF